MKTLDEWIALYEKKTGEAFQNKEGFRLFFLPERGFCQMRVDGKLLVLSQVCGDGQFWIDHSQIMASVTGCNAVGTFAVRKNIEAFIRLGGYRVDRTEELLNGLKRYFCVHIVLIRRRYLDRNQGEAPESLYLVAFRVKQGV